MALKSLFVKIGANTSGFQRGVKEVQGGTATMKSALNSLASAAAAVFGAWSAIDFGKTALQNAMSLESSAQQISRTMGTNAAAFSSWAKNNADAYNMSEKAATKYGAVFSNLISSFESDTTNITGYTTSLLKAAAITSSATGRTMDDTLERIRSGMLGSTEAIEDLGINVNVAMLESTNAFKKFAGNKSWDQLDFKTQQQIRLFAILEQTSQKYGDSVFDNTSSQYAQAMAQVENATTAFGNALLPAVTVILPAFTELVTFVTPGITALGEGISSLVGWVNNLNPAAKNFITIAGVASALIPAVTLATKGLVIAKGLLRTAYTLLIPKVITFGTVLKASLGWIALAATAVGLLWGAFGGGEDRNVEKTNTELSNTGAIANNASDGIDNLSKSVGKLKKAKNGLRDFDEIDQLNDNNTGNIISDKDMKAVANITDDISGLQSTLNDVFDQDYIIEPKAKLGDVILGIGDFLSDTVTAFAGTSDESYLALQRLDDRIRLLFGDRWTEHWNNVGSNMYQAFSEQEDPIIGVLSALNEFVRGTFGDEWVEFWGEAGSVMYDVFQSGYEELEQFGRDMHSTLYGLVTDYETTLYNLFKDYRSQDSSLPKTGNNFAEVLNTNDSSGIKGFLKKYFNDYSSVKLPQYATGGIVTRPTIAQIGESGAEAVVPLENNTGWIDLVASKINSSSDNQQPIDVYLTVELDGETVARKVTRIQQNDFILGNGVN